MTDIVERAKAAHAHRWEAPGPDYPEPVPSRLRVVGGGLLRGGWVVSERNHDECGRPWAWHENGVCPPLTTAGGSEVRWCPKMLRERLCVQQAVAPDTFTANRNRSSHQRAGPTPPTWPRRQARQPAHPDVWLRGQMSFAAKYSGRCNSGDCNYGDNRISQGDEVDYFDDELMHADCARNAQRTDPPCCLKCWTYHRGECA